jgi:hypothetical protein
MRTIPGAAAGYRTGGGSDSNEFLVTSSVSDSFEMQSYPTGTSRATLRWVLTSGLLLFFGMVAAFWFEERRNSADVPFPSDSEIRTSFSRAAAWAISHRDQILNDDNAMLWFFVREASRVSADPNLSTLAQEYRSQHKDSIWRFVFDPGGSELLQTVHLSYPTLPDYNRLFIYGATCNNSLREDPDVVALLDRRACHTRLAGLRNAWCRTHQLMGLRFVQSNSCEPAAPTTETIRSVQDDILRDMRWDFRVEDAYIQKVMMLVESGRRRDVKAIWLRRVMDAQRPDGGWDGVDIIAPAPGGRVIGWGADGRHYPELLTAPVTNFHATAQGLYLMALLIERQ